MEHALSDEAVADLERVLGWPATDPHGRPIPPAPGEPPAAAAAEQAR
jgi:Mn-dependent DtxR family transcriptional regulator